MPRSGRLSSSIIQNQGLYDLVEKNFLVTLSEIPEKSHQYSNTCKTNFIFRLVLLMINGLNMTTLKSLESCWTDGTWENNYSRHLLWIIGPKNVNILRWPIDKTLSCIKTWPNCISQKWPSKKSGN